MKFNYVLQSVLAGFCAIIASPQISTAQVSSVFEQQEINQSRVALTATPYNGGYAHQLSVLEQVGKEKACWSEQGNSPTVINPLLLSFDFTNICARGVDGNGYSIRINGEDMYLHYTPRIVEKNGELLLIGKPNRKGNAPLVIARSHGSAQSFSKLILEPGWRITKRVYQGKVLDHFYLTNDQLSTRSVGKSSGENTTEIVKLSNEF